MGKLVTFALVPAEGIRFAEFLERFRKDDIYTETIGLPDGTDIKMDRCFAYPYAEYGEVTEACLAAKDNNLELMLFFKNYRVVYSLVAQNQWNSVEVSSFAGTNVKYNYDFFNRMKTEHLDQIKEYFNGKLVVGRDNLYAMFGSDAADLDFLVKCIYNIVLK